MRLMGDGEFQPESMTQLLQVSQSIISGCTRLAWALVLTRLPQVGEQHARKLFQALESKLREEDLRRGQKAQANFDHR